MVYVLIAIFFLSIHGTDANAEMECGSPKGNINKRKLIEGFSNRLDKLETAYFNCCDSDCSFAIDNKTMEYVADGVIILSGFYALYEIGKKGKASDFSSIVVPNIIVPAIKTVVKSSGFGKDKKQCTNAMRIQLHSDVQDAKAKVSKIKAEDLDRICRDVESKTIQEKNEILLSYIKATPVENEPNRSPRTINRRRPGPNEIRRTEWDHYCKKDGQDYCAFLIYAGKSAYSELYAADIGNHDIGRAYIRISAVTDDIPPNPYVLNYGLIISVNDHRLPGQFKLTKIEHGIPVKGPFGNFSDEIIELPESAYQYFVSGDNEISYRLDGPVGSWIVFRFSELTINLR